MEDMKGKVALVTGAAQGIGLACAEAFARAGAVAVLADINRPEEQARKLAESGLKAEAFACDVSDAGEVEKMVEWIAESSGASTRRSTTPEYKPRRSRWRKFRTPNSTGLSRLTSKASGTACAAKSGRCSNRAEAR